LPLDSWDVSNATDMHSMFDNAIAFDSPIGSWDVSHVVDFSNMFAGTMNFNQNIE